MSDRSSSARSTASVAIAATLGSAILWGTSFSVNDIGLSFVGPATFAMLRFALAGAVVLAIAAVLGRATLAPVRRPWFWLLAAANALGFLLQYLGQTMTSPARTALFVNTSAFTVALIERIAFRQRLGGRRVAAIVVGVLGAALLIVGDPRKFELRIFYGDILAALSGIAWAVYFVMNQRAIHEDDTLNVTAWTFALTAVMLSATLWLDPHPLAVAAWPGWLAIGYAGLVTTALAYGLWSFGLKTLRASASAVLLLVEILVASIVSLLLKRESFGWIELSGALLLVAAVVGMTLIAEQDAADPEGT